MQEMINEHFRDLVVSSTLSAILFAMMMALRYSYRKQLNELIHISNKAVLVNEVFESIPKIFLLAVSLYVGTSLCPIPSGIQSPVASISFIIILFQTGIWLCKISKIAVRRKTETQTDSGILTLAAANIVNITVTVFIWTLITLMILDQLGYPVKTLLTGLGIGGLAIALAVKNVLEDLFASLSIVIDKPFSVGDLLVIDDLQGTVEHVGIKTTRLRSISGEQIIFSNNDLLKSRVRNFQRMQQRRVLFQLGIAYDTPKYKLDQIQTIIQEIVDEAPNARFDRAHFSEYGQMSLIFEVSFYVTKPDKKTALDAQHRINLEIHEKFSLEGIEFGYVKNFIPAPV